jgi:hypothetical protein
LRHESQTKAKHTEKLKNVGGGGGQWNAEGKTEKFLSRPFPPCHWSSQELKKEKKCNKIKEKNILT